METYEVWWGLAVDAGDEKEAALQAWAALMDPGNVATVLEVRSPGMKPRMFDMDELRDGGAPREVG